MVMAHGRGGQRGRGGRPMRGLGARIALRALPMALLTGGIVVGFGYVMTRAMMFEEGTQQFVLAVGWRIGGAVAGLSFLLLALFEWLRWRREKILSAASQPPAR